ncbi:hypothetical protein M0811_08521 [Anaeramoeba ignava]|uniref:BTB domain-containing protein n=1 Tax=Anaeramoeba ignava TaxID=1746090 RepID=A0A9Q0LJQ7_ANAIG|nr:hypothetical protein M0811_08521 [Anaeramoeba ignava]
MLLAIKNKDIDSLKKYTTKQNLFLPNNSPLHVAISSKSGIQILSYLLSLGYNINETNVFLKICKYTFFMLVFLFFLHYACIFDDVDAISFLLKNGANPTCVNGQTANDLTYGRNTNEIILSFMSVVDDISKLFTNQELTDLEIKTASESVFAHSLIVKLRLEIDDLTTLLIILKSYLANEVKIFMKWVYGETPNEEETEKICSILEKIGINKEKFNEKTGRNGLLKDLIRLFQIEESKDFKIISEGIEINIHKVILLARSELYRGMFLSVNDKSNKVSDYSRKKPETVQALVNFLYTENLDPNLPKDILEELHDAHDYYQLSPHSSLPFLLDSLLDSN